MVSVDGDEGWSVIGGELSWAGFGVGKVVRHYGICVGKRREGYGAHVTTHISLGM